MLKVPPQPKNKLVLNERKKITEMTGFGPMKKFGLVKPQKQFKVVQK